MPSSQYITDFPDGALVHVWFQSDPKRDRRAKFAGAIRWEKPGMVCHHGNGVLVPDSRHPSGFFGVLGCGWQRLTIAEAV